MGTSVPSTPKEEKTFMPSYQPSAWTMAKEKTGWQDECDEAMQKMMDSDSEYKIPKDAYYWWGLALKDLWGFPHLGGVKDLEECKKNIDKLIERMS